MEEQEPNAMRKLLDGLRHYIDTIHDRERAFFESLADGQNPKVLFITCSDSRVDPSLITQAQPGELFVLRNAGNIVPSHMEAPGGEAATVEYAVTGLGVTDIVVCGHSGCGAMKGLLESSAVNDMISVQRWLVHAQAVLGLLWGHSELDAEAKLRAAVKLNVLIQLQHLRTHPCVSAALTRKAINLHGWYYDIPTGVVLAFEPEQGAFMPLLDHAPTVDTHPRDLQRLVEVSASGA